MFNMPRLPWGKKQSDVTPVTREEIEEIARRIDAYRAELEFPKLEVSAVSTREGAALLAAAVDSERDKMPGETLSLSQIQQLGAVVEKNNSGDASDTGGGDRILSGANARNRSSSSGDCG